jgi:hypothetical protein
MIPLKELEPLLERLMEFDRLAKTGPSPGTKKADKRRG